MDADHLCRATTRAGTPCQKKAGHGTDHPGLGRCRNHGGASPQANLGGRVELARRQAAAMGRPLDIDPVEAILECVRITAGEVKYFSDRIAEIDEDDVLAQVETHVDRKADGDDGLSYSQTTKGPPQLHIWIRARHAAMRELREHSKVAIVAGIAERHVRIAERQGQLIAGALDRILTELGVRDHPKAATAIRRELTLIAGGRFDVDSTADELAA